MYAFTWKHTCARSRCCVYVWRTGRLNTSLTRLLWIDSFTRFSQTTLGEFHLELDLKSDHNAKITSHTEPISYHMHGPSSPHKQNFPGKCRKKLLNVELNHPSLSVAPHPSIYFLTCCSLTLCARWRINSWSRQEHPATQCWLLMAEQCGDELWWLSISAVGSDLMEAGGVAHQQLWITVRHHFTINRLPYVSPKALLKQGCRDLHWQNLSHLFNHFQHISISRQRHDLFVFKNWSSFVCAIKITTLPSFNMDADFKKAKNSGFRRFSEEGNAFNFVVRVYFARQSDVPGL